MAAFAPDVMVRAYAHLFKENVPGLVVIGTPEGVRFAEFQSAEEAATNAEALQQAGETACAISTQTLESTMSRKRPASPVEGPDTKRARNQAPDIKSVIDELVCSAANECFDSLNGLPYSAMPKIIFEINDAETPHCAHLHKVLQDCMCLDDAYTYRKAREIVYRRVIDGIVSQEHAIDLMRVLLSDDYADNTVCPKDMRRLAVLAAGPSLDTSKVHWPANMRRLSSFISGSKAEGPIPLTNEVLENLVVRSDPCNCYDNDRVPYAIHKGEVRFVTFSDGELLLSAQDAAFAMSAFHTGSLHASSSLEKCSFHDCRMDDVLKRCKGTKQVTNCYITAKAAGATTPRAVTLEMLVYKREGIPWSRPKSP
jgi:hypothetical protein